MRGDEFAHALAAASRVRHELTEAQQERTRLHQGFDALAQVMKVGVILVRKDRRIDFANERALELFGASDVEALRALWTRTAPDVGALFADASPAAPGGTACSVEMDAGGRALQLEVYRQGPADGPEYLALVHDPRALDALETDVRLASQLDGLARTYRTAAHEIRSPLAALMINLDLLRDSLDSGEASGDGVRRQREAYVSVLSQELTRLNRSLSELLTQSLPAPDSQERFDLRSVIEELGMLLAPQARRLGVELSTRLPPTDVVLVGYRDRLKQAFLNVAVNALEAMPKGGRMGIEMQECSDRARVAVRDTGPGIPAGGAGADLRQRLHHQGRRQRHRALRGPHRGRAARRCHRGAQRPGRRHHRGDRPAPRPSSPPSLKADRMPHALIVDDDLSFQLGLAEVVSREGFTTSTASSLASRRGPSSPSRSPDVLLTDLQLPDGSGLDLLQEHGGDGPARGRPDHRPRERRDRGRGAARRRRRLPHQAGRLRAREGGARQRARARAS